MKILTVIGARPQIIKSAIVGKQLDRCGVTEVVVHTGQHYDDNMSDMFFRELGSSTLSAAKNLINCTALTYTT
jgi:UDP-GlcNAc3NAcA epimerase